jgi:adenylate kinase family enzyme
MYNGLVVVNGRPGSGKTSAAIKLTERLNSERLLAYHLSIGDRLRAIASGNVDSAYSKNVKKHIGKLSLSQPIPSHIPGLVIKEAIHDKPEGLLVLDGYPRFEEQLSDFHRIAYVLGSRVLSIELSVTSEIAMGRLLNRGDRPGEMHYSKQLLQHRMEEYQQSVAPTLQTIAKAYDHIKVDASLPLEKVAGQMEQAVQIYLK